MSTAEEIKSHADEMIKAIKSHDASWDDAYRHALSRNLFSKWMGEDREIGLAQSVARAVSEAFGYEDDDEITVEWCDEQAESRRNELIESQDACCNEIEEEKASLEAATERAKSAKASIEEAHSRLRFLSRELRKPFVFPLPSPPSRQRELPLGDGEEWRAVPLSDVLSLDVALKSVAVEKLGNINLGQYAEAAASFGAGDKPKKLTRKQWDRIEAIVQEWHESQASPPSLPSVDAPEETTLPGGHGVNRTKGRSKAASVG